ncbi:hypothetical protein SAY86_016287 [Trapa natans]|uniref:Uncharacterized protein n=1 Tax=Trapa natans TaxID=22666 RepID=A0AAN7LJA7_TRANT|nr:hypothetical protein SAY86_016287 [Trapa natans]
MSIQRRARSSQCATELQLRIKRLIAFSRISLSLQLCPYSRAQLRYILRSFRSTCISPRSSEPMSDLELLEFSSYGAYNVKMEKPAS